MQLSSTYLHVTYSCSKKHDQLQNAKITGAPQVTDGPAFQIMRVEKNSVCLFCMPVLFYNQ